MRYDFYQSEDKLNEYFVFNTMYIYTHTHTQLEGKIIYICEKFVFICELSFVFVYRFRPHMCLYRTDTHISAVYTVLYIPICSRLQYLYYYNVRGDVKFFVRNVNTYTLLQCIGIYRTPGHVSRVYTTQTRAHSTTR